MENKRYKAPFDMYGGEVKKGDVFVKSKNEDNEYSFLSMSFDCIIPDEIVEKYFEEVKEELEVEVNYALNYFTQNGNIESIGFTTEEERMDFIKQNAGTYELKTIVISK
jgi:hypothetical protein